jgi:nucleoside-diphosphate-sugar epimerase
MACISLGRVVESFFHACELPGEELGSQRTVLLNGVPVSAQQMRDAAGGTGKVRFEPDPAMQKIMDGVAQATASKRAVALGFRHSANIEEIVDEYKKDHPDPALARNG